MDFDQLTRSWKSSAEELLQSRPDLLRTQPAISAQVRQLSRTARGPVRAFRRRISLTTAGKIFTEYAEQMLDLRRRAQDVIAELETNPRGELVIAGNEPPASTAA